MQIILTFGLEKEKLKAVRDAAQKGGSYIKEVSRRDYGQKLGTLAGIDGFFKEKNFYNGPDFPMEMIVFSGMDSTQVDAFLANYNQTGIEPVPLKAVITPHNLFWTADQLFHELFDEHMNFI